jgi:predicted RNA-binding protein YlxR (DUF448 family)
MPVKKYPIRMCIACRNRDSQSALIRIQFEGSRVIPYRGEGRSSYICRPCSQDIKRIRKIAKRFRVEEAELVKLLKEYYTDG